MKIQCILQEVFEENLHRLREAVSILQVEPDSKEELQEEMSKLSQILEESCEDEEWRKYSQYYVSI